MSFDLSHTVFHCPENLLFYFYFYFKIFVKKSCSFRISVDCIGLFIYFYFL